MHFNDLVQKRIKSASVAHVYITSKSKVASQQPSGTIPLPKKCLKCVVLAVLAAGLAATERAAAQAPPTETTVRMKYVHYQDFQAGGQDRMRVGSPMAWSKGAIGHSADFEVGVVGDATSGASPVYLDTLSGASMQGIQDQRNAFDAKFNWYFDSFSVGVGGAYSTEHDYLSRSANAELKTWTSDKNTVFSLSTSSDWDVISSSNNPDLEEGRRTYGYQFGVTQVLSPDAIIQSNLSYSSGSGFFNDPYKSFENRPGSREAFAWLTRLNYYVAQFDGSVHLDYRFFRDSWGVQANMVEARYYQPIMDTVTVVPILRYSMQNSASFFLSDITNPDFNSFMSADQRLGDFGSVTTGAKLIFQLTKSVEIDALYQFIQQSSRLSFRGADGIRDFGAHYTELGLAFRF